MARVLRKERMARNLKDRDKSCCFSLGIKGKDGEERIAKKGWRGKERKDSRKG